MSSNFKVDSLLISLKDLQSEKNCLEQKLNKRREKRRQCECELERVEGKMMQVSDVHRKMVETLKVAQLKVTQTQGQTDSLEEANQRRRDRIAGINNNIANEKIKQQENVNSFEDKLSELTEDLMKARAHYKDENLHNLLVSSKEKLDELTQNLNNRNQEVKRLTDALEQLKSQTDDKEQEIPEETCKHIWQMMKDENQTIHSYLNQLQTDLKVIHDTTLSQETKKMAID
ncbi:synaptonemal complex central element protein 1-like [Haliotis cracherodii]|uniref:synaptonemal complex central element protein 1-like n=1 Tax=Haliotis cracherodii TaxID=6455 RepID=UPI0039E95386